MTRRTRFITVGAVVGAAIAAWAWHGAQAAIAAGENAAGVGFGLSHGLFFISLPWSILVWAILIVISMITGADGPAFLAPAFYAMPVVAGAGWGWLASYVGRRRARRAPAGRAA